MKKDIKKLVNLRLTGKFAQFRKFYTNSSSLSYFIPPRTVVCGMLASILEIPRNEYYELFSPSQCAISIIIESPLKKVMQSMNYLHGLGNAHIHSQCKLEMVFSKDVPQITYQIYIASLTNEFSKTLDEIVTRTQQHQLGYGVYFGQRQFKADVEYVDSFSEIEYLETSDRIDSLCRNDHVVALEEQQFNKNLVIVSDQMPIHMKEIKNQNLRETVEVAQIVYEQDGQSMIGKFQDCYKIGGNIIGFFEK